MRLPVIRGIIDRRILVNYRVDPDKLAALLPQPFRPKLVHGYGMAGICLIRLKEVRPTWAPRWLGIASENAAHRIAVEWRERGARREGVFILRRDTNSRLNALAGGRIFPGVHHHAAFAIRETRDRFEIALESDDRQTSLAVVAESAEAWPSNSIFASLDEASRFFEAGSLGYSPSADLQRFQGLELRCRAWHVEPLTVRGARSSLFDDPAFFPPGSIKLDCALLMRGIEHEWHGREDLCCHLTANDSAAEWNALGPEGRQEIAGTVRCRYVSRVGQRRPEGPAHFAGHTHRCRSSYGIPCFSRSATNSSANFHWRWCSS